FCGLMHGDNIVSSYKEQITQDNMQLLIAAAITTIQNSPSDCSTGKTPDKPTPSPKAKESCSYDDLLSKSFITREFSMYDLLPCVENSVTASPSSVQSSPTSTNEKSSQSVTPAFSESPSTSSLPELNLPLGDCTTGKTPDKPTPSPKR
ncbi:MAG TPA: hypothetical protein VLG50_06310, partial [Candidatus Saccharimonadales bacterium]|nr:hypothetical protein [Candidatus Saccharimonadales bacterium]